MQLGTSRINITPAVPVELAGYRAYRKGTADPDAADSQLEAAAFYLQDGEYRALLLSLDAPWIAESFYREMTDWAEQQLGIAGHQCMIAATHTHGAPQTDPRLEFYGSVSDSYIRFLNQQCRKVIRKAAEKIQQVHPFYVTAEAADLPVVNRISFGRQFPFSATKCFNSPNTARPVDKTVRTLGFYDERQKLAAILVNLAAHPVFHKQNKISADYPGLLRTELQKKYGDLPVIILQGFAGDVRPHFIDNGLYARLKNRVLYGAAKPDFLFDIADRAEAFAKTAAKYIDLPETHRATSTETSENLSCTLVEKKLFPDEEATGLKLHRLDIPNGPTLAGVNGEVFSGYGQALQRLTQRLSLPVMPVGYANGMAGYLPDAEVLKVQSGYEYESWTNFGCPQPMPEQLPRLLRDGFGELFEQEKL